MSVRTLIPRFIVAASLAAALTQAAAAQVTRIVIDRREPFAAGQSFGDVGPYEKLVGSLYVEVDPAHAANARITDLQLAPRNAHGRVEFRTDFYLIKPVDPSRGNGALLYDVHNRGGKVALGSFNGAGGNDPDQAGTGFLMQRGYSVLWTGWSGDVISDDNRLVADFPVAMENGRPVTGRIYTEWESGGYQLYRTRRPRLWLRLLTVDQSFHGIHHRWPFIPWHRYAEATLKAEASFAAERIEAV